MTYLGSQRRSGWTGPLADISQSCLQTPRAHILHVASIHVEINIQVNIGMYSLAQYCISIYERLPATAVATFIEYRQLQPIPDPIKTSDQNASLGV